jgi:cyclic pyranopterin phosphate synthase
MAEKIIMMAAQRRDAPAIPAILEAPTGLLSDQ